MPVSLVFVLGTPFGVRDSLLGAGSSQQVPQNVQAVDPAFAAAENQRKLGHPEAAEWAFDAIARQARAEGDTKRQARALLAKGGCQLREFRYANTLSTYEQVQQLAEKIGDVGMRGIAALNIASVHFQLDDLPTALRDVQSSIQILTGSSRPDALVKAFMLQGELKIEMGKTDEAIRSFHKAINLAQHIDDHRAESQVWDHLGESLLNVHRLAEAQAALTESYRLRVLDHDESLPITRAHLAELELAKGNFATALKRLDAVLAGPHSALRIIPEYQIQYRRAQMLEGLHRDEEALQIYRKAVHLARDWREGSLPGETALASTSIYLHNLFDDASNLAARLALLQKSDALARESLEILAASRAFDLRDRRALTYLQQDRLPPRYFTLLSELQAAQSKASLTESERDQEKVEQIRLDLFQLAVDIGLEDKKMYGKREKNSSQKSLIDVQQNLTANDLLLSFNLGESSSWLWAVTRDSISLEPISKRQKLLGLARSWSTEIREGRMGTTSGQELARELFGKLPPAAQKARNWMVVSDSSLFQGLPIADLPDINSGRSSMTAASLSLHPLIEGHSIRYIPSEFSITEDVSHWKADSFLGIGDPIYNLADSRLGVGFSPVSTIPLPASALGRLVGSGREIRSAAGNFPETELLMGRDATSDRFREALSKKPSVVHFAVHVISPKNHPEETALALSLGKNRLPELLTPERISTYRVPDSIIVLSGCDSQQAKAIPGLGLVGISRAWLTAGASAVIVSSWPTADDGGKFFASFYRHLAAPSLASSSPGKRAAVALALTQLEMQHSNGYRKSPSFWAAYNVVSKE